MLVQAIPAYRLPREELGREISMIEKHGRDDRDRQGAGSRLHPGRAPQPGLRRGLPGRRRPERPRPGPLQGRGEKAAEGVIDALAFLREYNVNGTAEGGRAGGRGRRRQLRHRRRPHRAPPGRQAREHHLPAPARADARLGRGDPGRRRRRHHRAAPDGTQEDPARRRRQGHRRALPADGSWATTTAAAGAVRCRAATPTSPCRATR